MLWKYKNYNDDYYYIIIFFTTYITLYNVNSSNKVFIFVKETGGHKRGQNGSN